MRDNNDKLNLKNPLFPVAAVGAATGSRVSNNGNTGSRTGGSNQAASSSSSSSSSNQAPQIIQMNAETLKKVMASMLNQQGRTQKPKKTPVDRKAREAKDADKIISQIFSNPGTTVPLFGNVQPAQSSASSTTDLSASDGWRVAGRRRNKLVTTSEKKVVQEANASKQKSELNSEGLNTFCAAVVGRCRNTRPTFKEVIVNGSTYSKNDLKLNKRFNSALRMMRDQNSIDMRAKRVITLKGKTAPIDFDGTNIRQRTVYYIMMEVAIWTVQNSSDAVSYNGDKKTFALSKQEFGAMKKPYATMWSEFEDAAVCLKIQLSRVESQAQTEALPQSMRTVKTGIRLFNGLLATIRSGFKEAEEEAKTSLLDLQKVYNEMLSAGPNSCDEVYNYHMSDSATMKRLASKPTSQIISDIMGKLSIPTYNFGDDDDDNDDAENRDGETEKVVANPFLADISDEEGGDAPGASSSSSSGGV